jgi:secreted Zn-dependent insulinase-like peptidase
MEKRSFFPTGFIVLWVCGLSLLPKKHIVPIVLPQFEFCLGALVLFVVTSSLSTLRSCHVRHERYFGRSYRRPGILFSPYFIPIICCQITKMGWIPASVSTERSKKGCSDRSIDSSSTTLTSIVPEIENGINIANSYLHPLSTMVMQNIHEDQGSRVDIRSSAGDLEFTVLPEINKGESDWRQYRAIRLHNKVSVILVNDPHSKTTAVAATVNVGAASDPRNVPGLAHFCEHMCFLGSHKYPIENAYKKFLAQHGGQSNGSTSLYSTTYKFEILADHAESALDIFANFFIAPLMSASGVQREVHAVDSENSKNLTADVRRRLQILKDLADPTHYFSKFTTGNLQTLLPPEPLLFAEESATGSSPESSTLEHEPDNVRKIRNLLLAFHAKHYRPDRLSVVIAGPQSLDDLQGWIVPRFGAMTCSYFPLDPLQMSEAELVIHQASLDAPPVVTPSSLPMNSEHSHFFETGSSPALFSPAIAPVFNNPFDPTVMPHTKQKLEWPFLVTSLPVHNQRQMVLLFPVPSGQFLHPDIAPAAVWSHLLGYEGRGSAFAALQNAGYVSSLNAGHRFSAPDHAVFQIDLGLTKNGELHWTDVIDVVFRYIRLVQASLSSPNPMKQHWKSRKSRGTSSAEGDQEDELARIWDEISQIGRLLFHQSSPRSVYEFAPGLASSLATISAATYVEQNSWNTEGRLTLSVAEILSQSSHVNESYDTWYTHHVADYARELAEYLIPTNCFVERCSKLAWHEVSEKWDAQMRRTEELTQSNGDKSSESCTLGGIYRHKEKWYGVEYFLSPIDRKNVALWNGSLIDSAFVETKKKLDIILHLPRPNPFLPRTLQLCSDLPVEARKGPRIEKDVEPPVLLIDRHPKARLWHRLDDRYALPHSFFTVMIRNAAVENVKQVDHDIERGIWMYDVHAASKSSIVTSMFGQAMAQDTYDADLAGLGWRLGLTSSGITFTFSGFSDRVPDLAERVLGKFVSGEFLEDVNRFATAKDKLERNLQTFLESRRADVLAMYYRNLLLSSSDSGIEQRLASAQTTCIESVRFHHLQMLTNPEVFVECFCTGNVSEKEARQFFATSVQIFSKLGTNLDASTDVLDVHNMWIPGSTERRLVPGLDIELHFSSQNPEEENGAVQLTYQSNVPGFRGEALSPSESLESSAALRLICSILREPLFNNLRTKQALGYIVTSNYDLGMASRAAANSDLGPISVPVDYLVISVLSRKMPPSEILGRVDGFLDDFRSALLNMNDDDLHHHARALSSKLLRPVQKLASEASGHFTKIQRYAPEIISGRKFQKRDIPWDSIKSLAHKIEDLRKDDLLRAWDRVVYEKETRARVVSCVYGSTFPLDDTQISSARGQSVRLVSDLPQLLNLRNSLHPFDSISRMNQSNFGRISMQRRQLFSFSCLMLAGVAGYLFVGRHRRWK